MPVSRSVSNAAIGAGKAGVDTGDVARQQQQAAESRTEKLQNTLTNSGVYPYLPLAANAPGTFWGTFY